MAGVTIDPVCGMTVEPAGAAGSSEYQGQAIYFCSLGCKRAFDASPGEYLKGQGDHDE
jgi:Cu+-exporting ATPase